MKKRPSLLQIAPGHRSVRYNTDLPPASLSKLFLQVLSMDRPFMPKYGTVSQVLLQLVVSFTGLLQQAISTS